MVTDAPRGLRAMLAVLQDSARRRKAASLAIALGLEALLLLLLLTLGAQIAGVDEGKEEVSTFEAIEFAAPPEPEPEPATQDTPQDPADPQQPQPLPQPEQPRPSPLLLNPQPAPEPPPPAPSQQPETPQPSPSPKIAAKINPGRTYGPVDTGNPRMAGDSERVGTAPNGEPLFAARWYREPSDSELAGYLSTANGPGYALIACKTVPGYYVEDCVLLSEGPPGSMMGRAVLAAAWQFRVRPARIGGREQFGSWVRIRIDYSVRKANR
ncbi:hypothetical protein CHX26_00140 [Porphyrobacter sp. HT-58-2]|nr:hypothetical protein CHX26_00140 [Porphyrobacter sp. HT-58-2]